MIPAQLAVAAGERWLKRSGARREYSAHSIIDECQAGQKINAPPLSKGSFEQIEIMTSMDLDEQCAIASVLNAIDSKIDLHRKKSEVLDGLFKALLHKLMTGEIRVADLDLSALGHDAAAGEAAA